MQLIFLRRSRIHRPIILLAILLATLLVGEHPAQAHGYIVRSIPQDRAVLSHAPTRIQVWFSEPLDAQFSTLTLDSDRGKHIELVEAGVNPANPAQMSARLTTPLPSGAYLLTIRAAFRSDGHVGTDTLVFWVGQPSGEVSSGSSTVSGTNSLEVIWRVLTLTALTVLFGALLLYWAVLVPAWGNPSYKAGNLPPRVMRRLSLLIWIAIVVGLGGTILAVLGQSMALFATDLPSILRSGQWLIVLHSTQVGDALTARLITLILATSVQAGAIYLASRRPEYVTPLWTVNAVIAATALGTLSASSHAAGATLWPVESIIVDWLHLLAESAWVGGLITLTAILPVALSPLSSTDRESALSAVLRRFSAIGVMAVALLITTGIYSALIHVRQPSDLTGTAYGQELIAKIALIAPLLLIGLYHHLITTQGRLAGLARRLNLAGRVTRVASSVAVESGLGIAVIVVAALLSATPPPVPPDARGSAQAPSQALVVSDLRVRLTIDPGSSGANSYEVAVSQAAADQPVNDAAVRLSFGFPALDKRLTPITLDAAGDGTYLGAGAELDRAGEWALLLDVTPPGQTNPIRAAFRWPLPESPPDTTTRQPSLLNLLALGAILGVFGARAAPEGIRKGRSANISATSLTIAVVAVAGTILLTILGSSILSDAARRSEALRNPLPAVVNPILADADSLAAGKTIYDAQCAACHLPESASSSPDATKTLAFAAMLNRVQDRHDADLFQVIRHGMGAMPAFDRQLNETQTWNVVNYLRSLSPVAP